MRNRFHSLCPYFAMFPEAFAEKWIAHLTRPNDLVLDPFCGRGTAPFQAILMGRDALACDINPVAYCVTRAKIVTPPLGAVRRRITQLQRQFRAAAWESVRRSLPEFFHAAFHPRTLRQVLFLRSALRWKTSATDCMIAALVLGSLHGESRKSPFYLSNQMPRTVSTKPAYSVRFWRQHGFVAPERDVFELLRNRVSFRYESAPAPRQGIVLNADMRDLPRLVPDRRGKVKCAITSPPYLDVTNFEEDQWLRLWFLGSAPHPTYRVISRDDRHERPDRYWNMIADMWRVLGQMMARRAHVVLRLGGRGLDSERLGRCLLAASAFSGRRVSLIDSECSPIRGRQTDSFRPGATGCLSEVDFWFQID